MKIPKRSLCAALAGLLVALPAFASDLTISQFRVRGPAGGNDEFIELHNGGGAPVDVGGYLVNASNASGTTGTRATLPAGTTIAPGCYLLLANAASNGYSGSVAGDVTYGTGFTDTGGIALIDTSGKIVDQVGLSAGSAYGEGTRLASLGSSNVDHAYARKSDAAGTLQDTDDNAADFSLVTPSVPHDRHSTCTSVGFRVSVADASTNEGDSGTHMLDFTLTLTEPAPAGGASVHVHTVDDTATAANHDYAPLDTTVTFAPGATTATVGVTINGDTTVEPDEDFLLDLSAPSAGLTIAKGEAIGAILNDDAAQVEIWQIQGDGPTSPYVGQPVKTDANIVTALGPQGFFMQTPDRRDDHNRLTSNGVYVYTGHAPDVAVGDSVDVRANVAEFYTMTELEDASVTVIGHDQRLPRAVVFDRHTPSHDPAHLSCGTTNFECFEDMRVSVPDGIADTGNQRFSNDPYAELYVSAGGVRAMRQPGLLYGQTPATPSVPVWDGNPEVFEMDADHLGAVPADTPIDGGARFRATGVLAYDFGSYVLWPTSLTVTRPNPMPRPVMAAHDPSVLRVGNLNVLRLCDTDPSNTHYTCGDDGEPTAAELAVKLSRLSAYIGDVLKLPDVLAVEEVENLPVLQQLATQLNTDHGTHYVARLMEGHDPSGIDVGYLVRSSRVAIYSVKQLGGDVTWTDPDTGKSAFLHDEPPLLLTGRKLGMHSFMFRLLAVHPKSRIGIDGNSASAERNLEKRFKQAVSIAGMVQKLQHAQGGDHIPLVVLGDFNAFQFTDGLADTIGIISGTYRNRQNQLQLPHNLVWPTLWNAVDQVPRNDRYSYLYTPNLGNIQGFAPREVPTAEVLDQALLDRTAKRYFVDLQFGRGDLDAPVQTADDAASASGPDKAIGVSDHDGFVLELRAPSHHGQRPSSHHRQ
ncbi:MAG TPA: lamin tail domain-containing protein [Rhodanobacteraceae bacterium]